MRILIGTAMGIAVGALFLVNVLGWVSWCPSGVFTVLHYPSILLMAALFPGDSAFWNSLPFVAAQWPMIGALLGLVLHLRRKSANPTLQRTPGSACVSSSLPPVAHPARSAKR